MLLRLQANLKQALAAATAELFDITLDDPVLEVPRELAHADLASPIAFDLAKRIKAATGQKRIPRDLAGEVAEWLRRPSNAITGISHIEVAGAGYINLFLDRASFLVQLCEGRTDEPAEHRGEKEIVEHTSVNPNKAAHVGHLRNAVLGDTVVRLLRAAGRVVEVQNYIDNTGVQVADVVVGFLHVEPHTIDEIRAIPEPFDYYCWDLYSRVGLFYRDGSADGPENPEKLALRTAVQHALEAGVGPVAELAEYVAMRNLEALLRTMQRIGIAYDVLPRESEVLHSNFWAEAFEILKAAGAVHYEESGKHVGCWVMRAEEGEQADDDEFAADKILVKSDGLVTYTGKDIAYHMWKLHRIRRDFDYRPFFTYPDGHVAWTTAPASQGASDHPSFGHGVRYVNVIDVGQSYVQDFVKRGILAVVDDPRVAESAHLDYEKVGLTVETCDELGLDLSAEERKKSFIGMSGRKGRGVKADDLIDRLEVAARDRLREAAQEAGRVYSEDEQREIVPKIAIGALRYFLMKFTRNSVIAFDFKEALEFKGETGPYIQYTVARLNSIFRKLDEAGLATEAPLSGAPLDRLSQLLSRTDGEELWTLTYMAAQFDDVLGRAVAALEPSFIAKYAFQLAQTANEFYHKHPVIKEPDEHRRALLIEIIRLVRATLVRALEILGIEAPARM